MSYDLSSQRYDYGHPTPPSSTELRARGAWDAVVQEAVWREARESAEDPRQVDYRALCPPGTLVIEPAHYTGAKAYLFPDGSILWFSPSWNEAGGIVGPKQDYALPRWLAPLLARRGAVL